MAGVLQQIEDDKALPETKKPTRIPVGAFKFVLRIEGVFDLECRAIKGLRQENEFDYIQEGGVNDYVHALRKPISKPYTFQVERYVGLDNIDYMPIGTEFVIPPMLFVKGSAVVGKTFLDVKNYVFRGAKVIGKDYGDLDAESSKLLVETTTIAYEELIRVGLPNKTGDSNTPDYKTLVDENKTAATERLKNLKAIPKYQTKIDDNKAISEKRIKDQQTAAEEEKKAKEEAGQDTRTPHEKALDEIQTDWKEKNKARDDKYKSRVDENAKEHVKHNKARDDKYKSRVDENAKEHAKHNKARDDEYKSRIDDNAKEHAKHNKARDDEYQSRIDENVPGHKEHNVDRTDEYETYIDDNAEGIAKQKKLVGQKYSELTAKTLEDYAKRMSEAQPVHPYQDYIDALKK